MRFRLLTVTATLFSLFTGARAQQPESLLTAEEGHLLSLVNQERQQRDLASLAVDPSLVSAAHKHTALLMQHHALSHDFPGEPQLVQRAASAGAHFDSVGENVALSNDVDSAHEELMLSPPHRANILNAKFNSIGIGIATTPNGQIYVTEDFAHSTGTLASAEIENDVLRALNADRAEKNLPPLTVRRVPMLEQEACRDQVKPQAIGRALSLAGWVGVFTGSDPNKPPPDVTSLALHREAKAVALGACFPPDTGQSYSLFQVIAVFFRDAGQ